MKYSWPNKLSKWFKHQSYFWKGFLTRPRTLQHPYKFRILQTRWITHTLSDKYGHVHIPKCTCTYRELNDKMKETFLTCFVLQKDFFRLHNVFYWWNHIYAEGGNKIGTNISYNYTYQEKNPCIKMSEYWNVLGPAHFPKFDWWREVASWSDREPFNIFLVIFMVIVMYLLEKINTRPGFKCGYKNA